MVLGVWEGIAVCDSRSLAREAVPPRISDAAGYTHTCVSSPSRATPHQLRSGIDGNSLKTLFGHAHK